MKKLLVALLALVAMSSMAYAQDPVIGLFDDVDGTICFGPTEVYVNKTVYAYAILPPSIPAITAAEFSITNWVGDDPACAITTAAWNTPLVIGTPGHNLALAFSPALPGPLALLGTITIFQLTAGCLDNYLMEVVAGNDSGKLVVVDEGYNEIDADGYRYTFNCVTDCVCEIGTATSESTWGSVKALF